MQISALARRMSARRSVEVYLGCDATPAALDRSINSDPAVLHIATHGSIDAFRPRLSAFVMSHADGRESDFSVADILRHRMTTPLVVLSACETLGGRLLPGEGVLGPAQAFLEAGAQSVVGSAWKIPDGDTAELMVRFYQLLLQQGSSAAQALRTAQLEQYHRTRAYAWAAFSLFGSPEVHFAQQRKMNQ
jgi:CHAT domain-containing protein